MYGSGINFNPVEASVVQEQIEMYISSNVVTDIISHLIVV